MYEIRDSCNTIRRKKREILVGYWEKTTKKKYEQNYQVDASRIKKKNDIYTPYINKTSKKKTYAYIL